jgi:hypothetical protein
LDNNDCPGKSCTCLFAGLRELRRLLGALSLAWLSLLVLPTEVLAHLFGLVVFLESSPLRFALYVESSDPCFLVMLPS